MKYKHAKVVSHPRAGSHYLAKLLNINFFNKKSYLDLYAGHAKTHVTHLTVPSTAVFYIYRDNPSTIKSMYVLRDRFGLIADSLEEFKSKKLSNMHSRNIKSKAIFNGELITEVDTYFCNVNLTIEEYLNEHKKFWKPRANFIIFYPALIEDFENCMYAINQFLEGDKTEFIRETKRIGWYDAKEDKKIFS